MQKIARIIDGYDRGIYTLMEAGAQILDCITARNIVEVYSTLPEQFKRYLISVAESAPTTDEEWQTTKYVQIDSGCTTPGYESTGESEDERCAKMQEWKVNHRLRIEAFRKFVNQDR